MTDGCAESTGAVLPTLGGGTRVIDLVPWESGTAALDRAVCDAGRHGRRQALRTRVEMSSRPVQQAPFRVLVGASMPAVLVEIGYLSNPEQEKALTSARYQDQLAQSLFDAHRAIPRAGRARGAARPQDEHVAGSVFASAIGVVAVALGWVLMATLARLQTAPSLRLPHRRAGPAATPPPAPAVPRIKATLFFASEDGRGLVPRRAGNSARRRHRRAGARARRGAAHRDAAGAARVQRFPPGTKLRGVVRLRRATRHSSISTPPCATSTPAAR